MKAIPRFRERRGGFAIKNREGKMKRSVRRDDDCGGEPPFPAQRAGFRAREITQPRSELRQLVGSLAQLVASRGEALDQMTDGRELPALRFRQLMRAGLRCAAKRTGDGL